MIYHPQINPNIFEFGVIKVSWYGMMYVVAFVSGYLLLKNRHKNNPDFTKNQLSDLLTYVMLGVLLGGRIGYVLFYGLQFWLNDWLYPFKTWQGGMSFHGGAIGVILSLWLFSVKQKKSFLFVTDLVSPIIPWGLFFGRIGNFINGELWGRVTDMPWGMIFPDADNLPRHPSQLYEAIFEGLFLWLILWTVSKKQLKLGFASGAFLFGYGIIRILVEFFREPDAQFSLDLFKYITMGQILSLPMVVIGIFLMMKKFDRKSL